MPYSKTSPSRSRRRQVGRRRITGGALASSSASALCGSAWRLFVVVGPARLQRFNAPGVGPITKRGRGWVRPGEAGRRDHPGLVGPIDRPELSGRLEDFIGRETSFRDTGALRSRANRVVKGLIILLLTLLP